MLQVASQVPVIWVYTSGNGYNSIRPAGYAGFLSERQQAKLERVRQARMLFDGAHRQYYLDEGRTQFSFPEARLSGGQIIRPYITLNVLRLICRKTADLLFGQEPLLRADGAVQQARLAELADRCGLHTLFYNTAVECAVEGEAFLESVIMGGETQLVRIPADEIFGEGPLLSDGQYGRYVRYALHNVGPEHEPIWLLLETAYTPGLIERRLWQLDSQGRKLGEVGLSHWPAPLEERTLTGIGANTITYVTGETVRDMAVSRIDGLVELQDELNAKQTQIGRVLAKHSDPKLAMPAEMFAPDGNIESEQDVFAYRERLPAYITWNAELEAAYKDRTFTLNALLIAAEMSPVLLGLKEGAAPDAARKLRLEATNSLSMVRRLAANWKRAIRRAVAVAQDLENTLPGQRYDRGPIAVEMRDGIPIDEIDQAMTTETLRRCGVLSRRRALEQQLVDQAAVGREMAELRAEMMDKPA